MAITAVSILLFIFVIMVSLVLLQIYLSKRENKWLGLILPGFHLVISIILMIFLGITSTAFLAFNSSIQVGEEMEVLPSEGMESVGAAGTDVNVETHYYEENTYSYDDETAKETEYLPYKDAPNIFGHSANFLLIFLFLNIPTMVDMMIYLICRKKVNKKSNIDKMKIQDL